MAHDLADTRDPVPHPPPRPETLTQPNWFDITVSDMQLLDRLIDRGTVDGSITLEENEMEHLLELREKYQLALGSESWVRIRWTVPRNP